jgi:hypothetical protein
MPVQARMVVAGMSATEAAASVGTVANSLTAVSGGQSAAAGLPGDVNRFTTVPASGGCILPALNPGDNIVVVNAQVTNALLLFPPVGGAINALATNGSYSIAVATPFCYVQCITPTQYHCFQSA